MPKVVPKKAKASNRASDCSADVSILSPDRKELAELMAEEMMHSKKGLSWDRIEAKASKDLKRRIQKKRLYSSFHGSAMNLLVGKGPVRVVFMRYRAFLYKERLQARSLELELEIASGSGDGSSSSSSISSRIGSGVNSSDEGEASSVHDDANTLLSLKVHGADQQRRPNDASTHKTPSSSKTRTVPFVTPADTAGVQRPPLLYSKAAHYQHVIRNHLDSTATRYDGFSQHLEETIATQQYPLNTIPHLGEILQNFFLEEQDHVFQLQKECTDVGMDSRRLDFFCQQMHQQTKAFLEHVEALLNFRKTSWLDDHRDMWVLQFRCMETILGLHLEGMVQATS